MTLFVASFIEIRPPLSIEIRITRRIFLTSLWPWNLWPLTLKHFQQWPLAWWSLMPSFVEIPPSRCEIIAPRGIVLTGELTTHGQPAERQTRKHKPFAEAEAKNQDFRVS